MSAPSQPGERRVQNQMGAYRYLDARTKRDMARKREVVRAAVTEEGKKVGKEQEVRRREVAIVNHDERVVTARTAFRLSPRP